MQTNLSSLVLSFLLSLISCLIFIPKLKRLKVGQTILKYVEEHKNKQGTPTMGGLLFIIPAVITFFLFRGFSGRIATVSITIGLAFMFVGFLDDFIKFKFKKNEGLKPYQKIIFQLVISIFAGVFAFNNGITIFYTPFYRNSFDLGVFTIPLVAFIFIAITNSVNLTDGLDGLAGSVSFCYLLVLVVLIGGELSSFSGRYMSIEEYENITLICYTLMGGILAFLFFNSNKASIFMGDTGSLSLGGFLGAVSIFSANSLFIPIIGIMFVLSCISVIIQVIHFKRRKKRIFLMAPIHHHFQMKGYSETKIAVSYSMITLIVGITSVISYL